MRSQPSKYQRADTDHRWLDILSSLGVGEKTLSGRNVPCPFCGGRDRFRFLNTGGAGTWICNSCGTGDGMHFVQRYSDTDFKGAVKIVADILPSAKAVVRKPVDRTAALRDMYKRSSPVKIGDPVDAYLVARGLGCIGTYPTDLRTLERCDYFEGGQKEGNYPAMLAVVRDWSGDATTLHVTYLGDGRKACVGSPKKIMSAMGSGAHVELGPWAPDLTTLAVTEGIETALAVRRKVGPDVVVWAAISAVGMKAIRPPPGCKEVQVWGDNDKSFTGQAAAYSLANRLTASGICVTVRIPNRVDTDWAD